MKITKTKHQTSNGYTIYTGLIKVANFTGIVMLQDKSVEIYMHIASKTKGEFKAYREFKNFDEAKNFIQSMSTLYPSLRAIKKLGFVKFFD